MDPREVETQANSDQNQSSHVYHLALDIGGMSQIFSGLFCSKILCFDSFFFCCCCYCFRVVVLLFFHCNLASLLRVILWAILFYMKSFNLDLKFLILDCWKSCLLWHLFLVFYLSMIVYWTSFCFIIICIM